MYQEWNNLLKIHQLEDDKDNLTTSSTYLTLILPSFVSTLTLLPSHSCCAESGEYLPTKYCVVHLVMLRWVLFLSISLESVQLPSLDVIVIGPWKD